MTKQEEEELGSDFEDLNLEGAEGAAKKKKKKKKKKKAAADGEEGDAPDQQEGKEAAEDGAENDGGEGGEGGAKKKKKRRKPQNITHPEQDNSRLCRVGNWPEITRRNPGGGDEQFKVPISGQYPNGNFPFGECVDHKGPTNEFRKNNEELKEKEKIQFDEYEDIRKAAECHRQVRKYVQSWIEPGMKMVDIVQRLEAKTLELIEKDGLNCGWGFPTGCSINHVAAHYTPNYGDNTVLQYDDVVKLDFGVQVNGRIIDSAFTVAFNEKYDELIKSTQDGTNVGIAEAGIDARFSEIGAAIQETIESYELELNGKTYPIRPIRNLNGHSIEPYQIHAGKSVPIVKNNETTKMEEGEQYAIETFASTGKAYVVRLNFAALVNYLPFVCIFVYAQENF